VTARRALALALLAMSLGLALPSAADEIDPKDVEVAVLIGTSKVPLSVRRRFLEVTGALPKAGRRQPIDSHDRSHDAGTFCYRFQSISGFGLLEFFDSDFGVHTAKLSRRAEADDQDCTPLSSEPTFIVGASRYALSTANPSPPLGFQSEEHLDSISFKREWTYSDPTRPHMWGTCFSRSISITVEPPRPKLRSIVVQNWAEQGC